MSTHGEEKSVIILKSRSTQNIGDVKSKPHIVHVENDTSGRKNCVCEFCGKTFTNRSNAFRHKQMYCLNNPDSKKYSLNNVVTDQIDDHMEDTGSDNKDQLIIDLLRSQKILIDEIKNRPQVGNVTSVNANTTVNNTVNTVTCNYEYYLNDIEIDLYEIKRKSLGDVGAINYVIGLVCNSNPNNKFRWFRDTQIFKTPEEIPIRVLDRKRGKIVIHDHKNSEILDTSGYELNRMTNRIVGKSFMKCINSRINPMIEQNQEDMRAIEIEKTKPMSQSNENSIQDRIEARVSDLYTNVIPENPVDCVLRYERQPTIRHLKDTIEYFCSSEVPK
jgi:hypothetical protein